MALKIRFADPTDVEPLTEAYARIVEIALNDADQVGRVVVAVYRNDTARKAKSQAVGHLGFSIPSQPIDAQAEIRDVQGNVVRPAVPRFPSYAELMTAAALPDGAKPGQALRDHLKAFLYVFLKTRPEFADSKDV